MIFSFLPEAEGRYMVIAGLGIIITVTLMAIFAPIIAPYDPIKSGKDVLQPPSSKHIMGTDNLGRDIFSRIIFGSRVVLAVVFSASLSQCFLEFHLV